MPHTLDQILPSLETLGIWAYWIIGAAALLEAVFVTGPFVPGLLAVATGGVLAQQGVLDFFDLVWFVTIGSFLGAEVSFRAGHLLHRRLSRRGTPERSATFMRARRLFQQFGPLALVAGRFFGPLAGFTVLAAALSGMERRRFMIWNFVAALAYGLLVPTAGFLLGDVLTRLGPLATRLTLFAAALVLALAVLWWLVVRGVRAMPFVLSVLRSMAQGVAQNPDVRAWAERHPRLARFIAHRLDPHEFSGLASTLLAAAFLYVLLAWAESTTNFVNGEAVIQADERLAHLIHAFWTPALLRLFTHIAALGDPGVVAALLGAFLAWLWAERRLALMLGLVVSVLGDVITVAVLKLVFDRPRPALAYFVEHSGSFPSGHAAISVAFYAMAFFTMWKLRWLGPVAAALAAVTLAFLIGLSRLYLIEHYLSDVVNGWLVGTLWMLIGIAVAQWWRSTNPPAPLPRPAGRGRTLAGIVAALLIGLAAWQIVTYDKARNFSAPTALTDETVTNVAALFTSGRVPNETESLFGSPLEPINVIILAHDESALRAAMAKAGWSEAKKPTLQALAQAAVAALTNTEDLHAPVTPYFWQTEPNDMAFQKSTPDRTLRKRHHVRIWRTRFVTPQGARVFVGAASFDDGLDWQLLHHIDPNIDAERDLIVQDLTRAGAVAATGMIAISKPRLGESVAGDPWFTDGKAALIVLK